MKKEQASNTDKELVMALMRQLEGKEEMIKALLERIDSLEATMQKMTDELSALRRMHFGTSSEKIHKDKQDEHINKDDEYDNNDSRQGGVQSSSKAAKRPYKRPDRRDYSKIEPDRIIELKPSAEEIEGARLLKVTSTYRFYYRPGKLFKVRINREIYYKDGHIITPPLPYAPESFERRRLSPSLAAWILTAKYYYHIPLERILSMINAGGLKIAKTTLFDYASAGIDALEGLYEAIRERVLSDRHLNIDETVQHLVDNELRHCRNVYDWGFVSPTYRLMYFSSHDGSRGGEALDEQIEDFVGDSIQSDGYGAYANVARRVGKNIMTIPCMAHVRRKFFDCLQYHEKYATEALDVIEQMFVNEKRYREEKLTAHQIEKRRRKELRPLLDRFRLWLKQRIDARDFLEDDNLGKAIIYAWKRIDGFYHLISNGILELTNNLAERCMRGHTVGRKNYLFCQNQLSVERTCRIYSVIESCKLSGVDPYTYLEEVFSREPKFGETWMDMLPSNIYRK